MHTSLTNFIDGCLTLDFTQDELSGWLAQF